MSVDAWEILISEPILNQIIGVPSTGSHRVLVYCDVTVDDEAVPDSVMAGVYKTDSPFEPVPTEPDGKAQALQFDNLGLEGNGPYSFYGCIDVPQGTNAGSTIPTLKNVILAVWAGRSDGMSIVYTTPQTLSLKGYQVHVPCPATFAPPTTALSKYATSKAKSSATKKAAKKK